MKKDNSSKHPHWKPYLDKRQSKVLFIILTKILREKGSLRFDGFTAHINCDDDKSMEINLLNLVRACQPQPVKHWKKLATDFVDKGFAAFQITDQLEDFDFVKDRLTIKLYPTSTEDKLAQELVKRTDLAEVDSVPAIDLGESYGSLTYHLLGKLKKSESEIMELALNNLKARAKLKVAESPENDRGPYLLINADDPDNTAACALILEDYSEYIGKHGSLVCVPKRDMLVVHPINDKSKAQVTALMLVISARVSFEKEYPVSPHCYYYNNGTFSKLSAGFNPKTNRFELDLEPDHPFKKFTTDDAGLKFDWTK